MGWLCVKSMPRRSDPTPNRARLLTPPVRRYNRAQFPSQPPFQEAATMATEPTPTPPPSPPQPFSALFQPPPVTRISSDNEDRTWAMLCHLGGIIGFFLIPLVLWRMK